ncbi:DUF3618 domain-containing protein [Gandjariella thermophila]|uniref:Cell division protein FtsB n=1 Tax=Gandjariella thermophila TaxID=1931992 RepID=A0A4D4JAZ9_9PSEU|nr:DUF3618 domain-containing protein [Gandjariella thermophila]GDY33831.1 hypothetical protein GTS_54640 [Gandjariella thermophila]
MARDPEMIQREIEEAREALAGTLDELSERAHPSRFVESGADALRSRLADPRIKYPLIGLGVLVVLVLLRRLFR